MDRRAFLCSVGATAVGTLAGCVTGDERRRTYTNPVFEPILADPTVVQAESGTFYAYGTADDWHDGEGLRVAPIVKSDDLVSWEYVGEAFDDVPDWKDNGSVWAPCVVRVDGRYVLYYSLSVWEDENPGIGVATADSPTGPFKDHGKLFLSDEIGVRNSIDPYYYEDGGTPYLFWGSFYGIYGIELSEDGTETVGEKFQIAGNTFEAAYVTKRDGSYYFFGSAGDCCNGPLSTYRVQVARSDSLEGPYRNRDGRDVTTAAGTTILEGSDEFVGPGHNTMVTDDEGTDWLLYHAYESGNEWIQDTPRRALMLDPVVWDDGWPTVEDGIPSVEHRAPIIGK